MSNKLILLLIPIKLREIDLIRYEVLDFEKKYGHSVEIHELIDLLYPKFSEAFQNNINDKRLKNFDSFIDWKKRFRELLKKYGKDIVVIKNISNTNLNCIKVNHELKINKVKVVEFSTLGFPHLPLDLSIKNIYQNIYRFISDKKKLISFLKQKLLPIMVKFLKLYPTHVIQVGSLGVPKHYELKKINVIKGNSFDYNMYLKDEEDKNNHDYSDYGLFLEAPSPLFQGDSYLLGEDKSRMGTPEKWFPSINNFFKLIENTLKIKIKIAPHPKVKHKLNPEYYFGREIVNKPLSNVVKKSKIIISRDSAGFAYAAIHKIPAIFIYTNELLVKKGFLKQQRHYANELGLKPINIDDDINEELLKELFKYDKKKYSKYVNKYSTCRDDKKRNFELINEIF